MPRQPASEELQHQQGAVSARNERRAHRSAYASEALTLQLQAAATHHHLPSLVLADAGGNLWAASCLRPSPLPLLEAFRRALPAQGGQPSWTAEQGQETLTVRRLEVGPATLYLAARGRQRQTDRALAQTASGVARILGALL